MTTSGHEVRPEEEAPMRYGGDVSSWVRGLAAFAAVMMVTVGVLQVLAGPLWGYVDHRPRRGGHLGALRLRPGSGVTVGRRVHRTA
jgi:hypothetical protein